MYLGTSMYGNEGIKSKLRESRMSLLLVLRRLVATGNAQTTNKQGVDDDAADDFQR